jgi:membrane protein
MTSVFAARLRRIPILWVSAFRYFLRDNCRQHAAALTFTTLFAVVPLLTVIFTLLAAFPSTQSLTQEVEAFIFQNLVPTSSEAVASYLQDFSAQAGQLTLVGIVVLVVTAIMMLVTIERAFNDLWEVKAPKQNMFSILRYWAVISLGPFLLGAGFFVSSYLASISLFRDASDMVDSVIPGLAIVPMFFTALGFSLLYIAVPNCKVSIRAGVLAGLAAAVLFEVAKRGFTLFIANFATYELVYGAFAAFPVFLLWLFLSWLIVLFGVELSRSFVLHELTPVQPQHPMLALLALLGLLQKRHSQGQGVDEVEAMRLLHRAPSWTWSQWKQWLQESNFMIRSVDGDFRLARDLNHMTLADLCREAPWPLPHASDINDFYDFPWLPEFAEFLLPYQQLMSSPEAPNLAQLLNASTQESANV